MTETQRPDNVLFGWYERYIGEPDAETDVYAGFGLFFFAIAAALVALGLFVVGASTYGIRSDPYFRLAQPAYVLGMLSVPLAMLSIVVLLPVKRRAIAFAGAGVAVTLVAVSLFVTAYPGDWFEYGFVETMQVVGTYAVGVLIVLISTAVALVAHHIEQARAPAPSELKFQEDEAEEETGPDYSEEDIERDIEEAMDGVEMTWGGVERSENRQLNLNTDYVDSELEGGNIDVEATKRVETGGVDDQVQGLRNLKGGEVDTATSESTVDDQTAALTELKKQKEADQVPDNAPTADQGVFGRILQRIGLS